jgi:hypothetical protein
VAEKAERIRGVPRGKETFVNEEKKVRDAAQGARGTSVTPATRPERFVVGKPPPEPDYPRYRVEPGTEFRLSDVDPSETEHYRAKKDVRRHSRRSASASGTCRSVCTPRTGRDF